MNSTVILAGVGGVATMIVLFVAAYFLPAYSQSLVTAGLGVVPIYIAWLLKSPVTKE
jgi:hypothetical protein